MSDKGGTPADDFPHGAGNPARNALRAAGYSRLAQLTTVTAAEMLALHGVGPKAVGVLRGALAAEGLAFAGE
ncbi:DNA-binding protein [Streptomyces sp. NE06-03C]|uniref:DNA-binding protein n=1 Tax=Streptomyces sp. NE06-03C TaxID=3028694 RepID=UPI0029A4E2F6|nr:DNA-binding protein [Streptomyces sp. NE06-03C]MDX2916749.1 DNA-binding protein [Streptomyces sp. NE06-03C]